MNQALFVDEQFTSHSSLVLPFKIDCDALSDEGVACFARIAHEQMGLPWSRIGEVVAVGERDGTNAAPNTRHAPTRLARALREHVAKDKRWTLILDDVYTTGASIEAARMGHAWAIGLVLFARTKPPEWIKYILALNPALR